MPAGSYFINGGRSRQVNEADLLDAVQSGHLDGAALDVFAVEPLPEAHPLWAEDRISIWPHVAAQTNPDTAADQVSRAIQAVLDGGVPDHVVNKAREVNERPQPASVYTQSWSAIPLPHRLLAGRVVQINSRPSHQYGPSSPPGL